MTEIVEAKAAQWSEFRECLHKSKKSTVYVESTFDDFWALGISEQEAQCTNCDKWPGKNSRSWLTARATNYKTKGQQTRRHIRYVEILKETLTNMNTSFLIGLNTEKFNALKRYDIVLLQERHYVEKNEVKHNSRWFRKSYHCYSNCTYSRGVPILLRIDLQVEVINIHRSIDGR